MDALALVPSPSADFDFETTPSLPSTPDRFGDYLYFSTPGAPSRVSLDAFMSSAGDSSSVDFEDGRDDFAFDYRAGREEELLSAEELFDCGMIRPLKLPPCLRPPRSLRPDSSSPKKRKESQERFGEGAGRERGRERVVSLSPSRRTARSHSPLRVSAYPWEEDNRGQLDSAATERKPTPSKKWNIKDLLLFRSASEGSATDETRPFSKYSGIFKRQEEAIKNSSTFSSDDNSNGGSTSLRRGRASAHELHYTANKAVSEGLKKKTFLPYRQGILGRLSLNPTVHSIGNGFRSLQRNRQ